MNKVNVTICMGTTCYVMGASALVGLADQLPADLKDRVAIEGAPCLDACKDDKFGQAPFVKVNDEIITDADPASVIAAIRKAAGG